jgi:hypothetical protein
VAADLEFRPLGADEGDGAVLIAAMIDELRGPYSALWRPTSTAMRGDVFRRAAAVGKRDVTRD